MAPYAVQGILANLWAIDELRRTTSFLYRGTERALLVDTGFGFADYRALLSELCPGLPIMVVNTHAHPDHCGGNNQFDEVWCGRFDEPQNHDMWPDEARREMIQDLGSDAPPLDAWHPGPAKSVGTLQDGDMIQLGGATLEVIEAPGHTPGSICLFDRANGLLFTGDLVLSWEVWGQLSGSMALNCYAQSLHRLASLEPLVRRVLPAHGSINDPHGFSPYELPPRVLSIYAKGTQAIVDGEAVGSPYRVGEGWREGLCVQFEIGGMAYDPKRIG